MYDCLYLDDDARFVHFLHFFRRWEGLADDHPSRKLFGGLGGEEEGPMIAQNVNPLADLYGNDEEARRAAEAAAEAARILKEKRAEEKAARKAAKAQRKAEREAAKKAKLLRNDSPQRSNSNGSKGSKGSGKSGGSKKSGKSGKSGKRCVRVLTRALPLFAFSFFPFLFPLGSAFLTLLCLVLHFSAANRAPRGRAASRAPRARLVSAPAVAACRWPGSRF